MAEPEKFIFPARIDKIRSICNVVADTATSSQLDPDAVFAVTLACDEACTNIIEHAYKDDISGKIELTCFVDQGQFVIILRDFGLPFDPTVEQPGSDYTGDTDPSEIETGGLGLRIMRSLVDELDYQFSEAEGNTLRLAKRIPA